MAGVTTERQMYLKHLLDHVRSATLARKLGLNTPRVWNWLNGRFRIPREYAEMIVSLPEFSKLSVTDVMKANLMDNLSHRGEKHPERFIPSDDWRDPLALPIVTRNIYPGNAPNIPLSERLLSIAQELRSSGF